jgi:hypothetical protein
VPPVASKPRPTALDDIRSGTVEFRIAPAAEPATGLAEALARLLIGIDARQRGWMAAVMEGRGDG